ncbi:golgi uridine diphosphate-N- acetylglucosamine transporter [Mycoemilia scoparia]|uniref:Golgi uridine diphosphate-N- acetylglucosamine transporter n=1 Tax=Mycoemilia scoparia TaxID=417184 RepID=A0A9W8DP12_9FUNG|nr:golgi uridine diphosphate-N- acetylglucosamine transporter [Mycoemilia scoparia]
MVTALQFIAVSLFALPGQLDIKLTGPSLSEWRIFKPRHIPITRWAVMVGLFFLTSLLNNMALNYNIAIPLHIIFRSSGLVTNMIFGSIIYKKRYPPRQIVAVILVTAGVLVSTMSMSSHKPGSSTSSADTTAAEITTESSAHLVKEYTIWVTGICILATGVVTASLLGLYQESTYKAYGRAWQEGLFYCHFMALPLFSFFHSEIMHTARATNQTPAISSLTGIVKAISLPMLDDIPSGWLYMAGNLITQLICVTGVHRLSTMASSLTLNLVLNLRKIVSLAISIMLFDNHFTLQLFCGCLLVFVGTLLYSIPATMVSWPIKLAAKLADKKTGDYDDNEETKKTK